MKQARSNLFINVLALLAYVVVANPVITGVSVHEWLGVGLIIVFLMHCIAHFDWLLETIHDLPQKSAPSRLGNLIVDALLLIVFMVATISGLGVSGTVLPTFGLYADGYYFWSPLHSISAKILLALFVIHLVIHWRMIFAVFQSDRKNKNSP